MTKVVHCKIEPYDVLIDRTTEWGNPYSHKEGTLAKFLVSSIDEAVSSYEKYLLNNPILYSKLRLLKDKTLGCWCKHPNNSHACHGDLLAKYADRLGSRTWSRNSDNGYEVSSKGDKRFSALNAIFKDGKSIEEVYQLDIKGYRKLGITDWRYGKGKPPIYFYEDGELITDPSDIYKVSISKEELYQKYLNLWSLWTMENPSLILELAMKSIGKELTDMFASSEINQARALTDILNNILL